MDLCFTEESNYSNIREMNVKVPKLQSFRD